MFNLMNFTLLQNVPNPVKNNTTIQFNTPNSKDDKISVLQICLEK